MRAPLCPSVVERPAEPTALHYIRESGWRISIELNECGVCVCSRLCFHVCVRVSMLVWVCASVQASNDEYS